MAEAKDHVGLLKFKVLRTRNARKRAYKFKESIRQRFEKYGLTRDAMEFIGHALALNLDDSYLERLPRESFETIRMYVRYFENHSKACKI